jgi:hypothetical protein
MEKLKNLYVKLKENYMESKALSYVMNSKTPIESYLSIDLTNSTITDMFGGVKGALLIKRAAYTIMNNKQLIESYFENKLIRSIDEKYKLLIEKKIIDSKAFPSRKHKEKEVFRNIDYFEKDSNFAIKNDNIENLII